MTDTTSTAAHAAPAGTEPLITRAWVISLAGSVVAILALFGVPLWVGNKITADAQTYGSVLATLVTLAAPHVLTWLGRKKVTPLARPKDNDGNDLVPAGTATILTTPVAVVAAAPTAGDVLAAATAIHPGT